MTTVVSSNATADAQRRFRRANAWFWFFVACIPLGVALPVLFSMIAEKIWGPNVATSIFLSALFCPLVGVAGAMLLWGNRSRSRRSFALAKLADSLGMLFTASPARDRFEFLKSVSLMANPHKQSARNLLETAPDGRPTMVLDYKYVYFWRPEHEIGEQTIAVFSEFESLPAFGVTPISRIGKLENLVLGQRGKILFPEAPEFSKNFAVVGENAPAIIACIGPSLIELLMADRRLTLSVENGRLLVFRRGVYWPLRDYQTFLAQAARIAELLAGGG